MFTILFLILCPILFSISLFQLAESNKKLNSSETKCADIIRLQREMLDDFNSVEKILKSKLKKKRSHCIELIKKNSDLGLLSKEVYDELQTSIKSNILQKRTIKELQIELQDIPNHSYNRKIIDDCSLKILIENEKYKILQTEKKKIEDDLLLIQNESQFWQSNTTNLHNEMNNLNQKLSEKIEENVSSCDLITNLEEEVISLKNTVLSFYNEYQKSNNEILENQKNIQIFCCINDDDKNNQNNGKNRNHDYKSPYQLSSQASTSELYIKSGSGSPVRSDKIIQKNNERNDNKNSFEFQSTNYFFDLLFSHNSGYQNKTNHSNRIFGQNNGLNGRVSKYEIDRRKLQQEVGDNESYSFFYYDFF